jgi:MraZ protein
MFLGTYQHSLDTKGRMIVPARFRDDLADGGFVLRGFDRCLMVMTTAYFESMYLKINSMNLADPATRALRRLLLANAYSITPDKVGRINLPQDLRDFATIDSDTVVVGQGEYFELWTPDQWQAQQQSLDDLEANIGRFDALDLSPSE